ncbi:hypothetical protein PGC08_14200 [Brevibacterium sp. BDJS002]|uniref:hypothetical protein n=1 Tax=Brevibacterium sp. BDJS002 TaxID=3020906 RepID=UPI0023075627|nr:hypothetical protein [Brevibacterium sp. BDJS002]WCE39142.1 hypothetical protein PGC08_14200 [Brevibacterium sp. BDJS002]
MSNYIDLEPKVSDYYGTIPGQERRAGICDALRYLDSHPDQVPGQTITQSEFHETADAHRNGGLGWEDLAARFGITIVPDPARTNAEKLADDIREVDGGHNLGSGVLAERLASLGWLKAPEGDDADKARSDAAWALNIDRQGGA